MHCDQSITKVPRELDAKTHKRLTRSDAYRRAGHRQPAYLKRAIQSQIENPLAKAMLEGRFAAKDTVKVDCKGGIMKFEKG